MDKYMDQTRCSLVFIRHGDEWLRYRRGNYRWGAEELSKKLDFSEVTLVFTKIIQRRLSPNADLDLDIKTLLSVLSTCFPLASLTLPATYDAPTGFLLAPAAH
jgi:hypothetical protein